MTWREYDEKRESVLMDLERGNTERAMVRALLLVADVLAESLWERDRARNDAEPLASLSWLHD